MRAQAKDDQTRGPTLPRRVPEVTAEHVAGAVLLVTLTQRLDTVVAARIQGTPHRPPFQGGAT